MTTDSITVIALLAGFVLGCMSQKAFWFLLECSGMLIPGEAITAGELKRMLYSVPEGASLQIFGADPRCEGIVVSHIKNEDGDWVVLRASEYGL